MTDDDYMFLEVWLNVRSIQMNYKKSMIFNNLQNQQIRDIESQRISQLNAPDMKERVVSIYLYKNQFYHFLNNLLQNFIELQLKKDVIRPTLLQPPCTMICKIKYNPYRCIKCPRYWDVIELSTIQLVIFYVVNSLSKISTKL